MGTRKMNKDSYMLSDITLKESHSCQKGNTRLVKNHSVVVPNIKGMKDKDLYSERWKLQNLTESAAFKSQRIFIRIKEVWITKIKILTATNMYTKLTAVELGAAN